MTGPIRLLAALLAAAAIACAPPPPAPVAPPPPADTPATAPAPDRVQALDAMALDAAAIDDAAIDAAVESAIARRVTPGAVVVIGDRDGVLLARGFGALDWVAGAAPAGDSSVYDLASLTKVVGTRSAVLALVEDGSMALDDPLSRHLRAWPRGGWRDEVTIRRLLEHRSGLAPFVRFWHPSAGALRGRDAVVSAIAALEPSYSPGERRVYSDLGYILLGAAVEARAGRPLDAFLAARVFGPLGMEETGFRPLEWADPARIAPTELDTILRHRHVHGEVHDENVWAMGGVAGHAGLFATAADLARFARRTLRDARPGDENPGWVRAEHRSSVAEPLSDHAFGHTGFTGTSLWIDPAHDRWIVLLTNRVNPTRDGTGIQDLRRAVHAAALPPA